MKRNPRFQVADIAIELKEDGTPIWWIQWVGEHAQQGGMHFGWGNAGSDSLERLLKILERDLEKNKDDFVKKIQEKK